MSADDRPARIALIACGGTIASVADDPLDTVDYPDVGRKIGAAEMLARIPAVARIAEVWPIDFRSVSSTAIGFAEWLQLRRHILDSIAHGADGVTVTHGTGSLEETAFFLSLTLDTEVPVVLTGAQRPLSAVSSDAAMNLIAAVRVAAAPGARGRGVLVVMNDEIHAARDVVKTATYSLQAFQSPTLGAIGYAGFGNVTFGRAAERPAGDVVFDDCLGEDPPRVDIVYSHCDADGELVRAAVAAGAKGIVSAGFAPGIPAPAELNALREARASGVMVVQASRALAGRVAMRTASRADGFMSAGALSPQKARILLMLCLMSELRLHEVDHCFQKLAGLLPD